MRATDRWTLELLCASHQPIPFAFEFSLSPLKSDFFSCRTPVWIAPLIHPCDVSPASRECFVAHTSCFASDRDVTRDSFFSVLCNTRPGRTGEMEGNLLSHATCTRFIQPSIGREAVFHVFFSFSWADPIPDESNISHSAFV